MFLEQGEFLVQRLGLFNSVYQNLQRIKQEGLDFLVPKSSPSYIYSRTIYDSEKIDEQLALNFSKKEAILEKMRQQNLDALQSKLKYLKFFTNEIENLEDRSKLIIQTGILEFNLATIVTKLGALIEVEFEQKEASPKKWFRVDEEILFEIIN